MDKIRVGVIGMGFIGACHIDALRRIPYVECVAVSDADYALAKRKAEEYFIPKCYETVDELIADPEIDVIHNCTTNNAHREINEKVIRAGKHIFSEKPLAMNSAESQSMLDVCAQHPEVVHGINHCYRMNPLVQEIKRRYQKDQLGRALLVHGNFLQDWLLYETDYNWRIEPEISGPSRCISDIGTHWMDTVQHVLGAKITEVCADLVTVYPTRKKHLQPVGTFQTATDAQYEDKTIRTEDFGAIMFKMNNGTSGVFYVSEVSAGYGCNLSFEIDGTKCSAAWNQEQGERMWVGHRDRDNELVTRNPAMLDAEAQTYTRLPKGHPEGWNDAETATFRAFYDFIRRGKTQPKDKAIFATFEEGHYLIKLVEAILLSNEMRRWVTVH